MIDENSSRVASTDKFFQNEMITNLEIRGCHIEFGVKVWIVYKVSFKQSICDFFNNSFINWHQYTCIHESILYI